MPVVRRREQQCPGILKRRVPKMCVGAPVPELATLFSLSNLDLVQHVPA